LVAYAVTAATVLAVMKTKVHPLWLLAAAGLIGLASPI
jgi:hypothetical protein